MLSAEAEGWIILDIMRKPNPIIVLLYIQNSHTKMQDAISPILILQCRFRERGQSTASHFVIL